jgi:exodeoxyribonuclease VII large subunit
MALETSPEHPAPVRQITQAIGQWIDRLGPVWVEGQVTQISRRGGMNTVFLTLRDKLADISVQVTCNRGVVDSLPTPLVEGAQVVCHAKPSFYANRGTLSLAVREIRLVGEGELLARLERRRQLLAAEGLFAEERKRALPFLPRNIGLVTAQSSAAERDVLENGQRRWPGVRFTVRYAAMQGMHAAREVIEAVGSLDRDPEVDVIVIARGGGSVEDLLPFSDEALVRAVFEATTPVVSAIGHEPDSPILDLVSDVRASTPTDAAKRVVPDVAEEAQRVLQMRERGRLAIRGLVERELHQLAALRSRPALADPRRGLEERLAEVEGYRERARRTFRHRLDRGEDDLVHQVARIRALSPLATLRRGYAVLSDADGQALSSVATLEPGHSLHIRVADGRIGATATSVDQIELMPDSSEDDDDD